MTPRDEQVRSAISAQASEWFVANDAGPLEGELAVAFIAWLKVSPVHVEEFLGVATTARDLAAAGAALEPSLESLLARAAGEDDVTVRPLWNRILEPVRREHGYGWRLAGGAIAAIGALAAIVLGVQLWRALPRSAPESSAAAQLLHFQTLHGQQRSYPLPDGSMLRLNTDTTVAVRYGATERLAVLEAGEATFEVRHEPRRPFKVMAGSAAISDLGTQFDVRRMPDSTLVTVLEGQVSVAPAAAEGDSNARPEGDHASVRLGADQQVRITAGTWPPAVQAVDARSEMAWLHRQIAFDHQPLGRVAAEFNRYATKPVEIVTPELRELQVSGVFSTDDPDEFLAFLKSLDGVRLDVTPTQIRVFRK
jgi:transmembrane sensor